MNKDLRPPVSVHVIGKYRVSLYCSEEEYQAMMEPFRTTTPIKKKQNRPMQKRKYKRINWTTPIEEKWVS